MQPSYLVFDIYDQNMEEDGGHIMPQNKRTTVIGEGVHDGHYWG